ncbi:MAG TPA: helix-hairpin-helix domain-containing protein [Polyangiaceae bacterium]|nr:helix-hairpin-helix domain-containing protein [Polyangiaceae bacterium]
MWRPILLKAVSVAAGMLGLAFIGSISTLQQAHGGASAELQHLAGVGSAGFGWLASPESQATRTSETNAEPSPPQAPSVSTQRPVAPAATSTAAPSTSPAASTSATPGVTSDGKVILNLATVEDLDRLPKVGKKTAERIIELRTRLGRFKRLTDLLRVKGIGNKTLQKMLPMLVLDG